MFNGFLYEFRSNSSNVLFALLQLSTALPYRPRWVGGYGAPVTRSAPSYGLSVTMVYSWRAPLKDDVCKMENGAEMTSNAQVWNGDLKQVEISKADKICIHN